MLTIAELPEYIRRAEKLMSASERLDIINYLATHPKAGDLMEGTGGVRKLRWGRGAQGKSGGVVRQRNLWVVFQGLGDSHTDFAAGWIVRPPWTSHLPTGRACGQPLRGA